MTAVTEPTAPLALTAGQPIHATTPAVTLQGMSAGTYTFQLVVTDNLGVASPPVKLTVQVTQPAVIK